ncbi:MAG: molybdopterin molybdochelatase [Frankiales bacterium]|nr:molybdopterin molybdochelatase [Frankiales bacterium]
MRTVEEHQAIVAALIRPPAPVSMAIADAAGLVLADNLVAPNSLPGFDNSAMDGYAVLASDIAGATKESPVTLVVADDIPAGRTDIPALAPGTAHRIMTGAPMPAGADAVVQVEATDGGKGGIEGGGKVTVFESRAAGVHVRKAGEDVAAGETVLPSGALLGPAQLGLLAALGQATVSVIPPVRVLVMSTGSELVDPGTPLRDGQIYDANATMLLTAIRAAGAVAEQVHFVPDRVEDFYAALDDRLGEFDLLLTSGGVSAGAYEVVKDALSSQGVEFAKVAMQPGMPQGAGQFRGVPVVTMPGNPVSALVSFEVFVRPALRRAMGLPRPSRTIVRAVLDEDIESPPDKRQFRRGTLNRETGSVVTVGPAGSHFLRWFAAADCLLNLPAEATVLHRGDTVEVWPLD